MSKTAEIRQRLHTLRSMVAELPASREASIVRTKLDEAALWLDQVDGEFGPRSDSLKG